MTRTDYQTGSRKVVYFDGRYAQIATCYEGDESISLKVTTAAHPDHYVRIDHGYGNTSQLCAGGKPTGPTLEWHRDEAKMGRQLARDCRAGYAATEEAFVRMVADRLGRTIEEARKAIHDARMEGAMPEQAEFYEIAFSPDDDAEDGRGWYACTVNRDGTIAAESDLFQTRDECIEWAHAQGATRLLREFA